MTTTLNVKVYQTYDLQEYCDGQSGVSRWQPAERAVTYLEGAVSEESAYNISASVATNHSPNPKQEGPASDSFSDDDPCDPSYTIQFDSLWDWWGRWLNCAYVNRAGNCDLLLTNDSSGGGLGGGSRGVVCVGQDIIDMPSSYTKFGYTDKFDAMDSVLEEAGHCFKSQGSCPVDNDGDGDGTTSHDSGAIMYDSATNDYGITPLGITGDPCHNDCAGTVADTDYCKGRASDETSNNDPDGWALHYSQCTMCSFP